ncbi:hypothetical protein BN946_scf184697.g22 [Trametes cinnabarina]|uniref:Uncharacterized protein n=1 Tax=Pycnoporus cinnabarinus TaxID=5643 RepID=A0A060S5X1_PYCCI|nr:hypothetical protein BN946_scf184697.g22 [Trametes cinnabarina]
MVRRHQAQAEYQELLCERDSLDSEDTQLNSPEVGSNAEKPWRSGKSSPSPDADRFTAVSPLLLWLGALVLVIACTDLVALFYVGYLSRTVFQDKDFAAHLEYASPYIGLDELYASGKVNASKIEPLEIRPRISAQVFVKEPDRLAPRGERDYWHKTYGRMSPHELRLHVTPDIRTVAQFRAIDFGMEDCHLVFTLPPLSVPLEKGASIEFNPSSRFDVYRLDSERPLDVQKLSYKTRPKVVEKVASGVNPRVDGETLIHRFPCPRASLHVFEVACADGSDCLVDTWSSHNTSYGINVIEHQTI